MDGNSQEEHSITIYVAGYPKSGTTWLTRLIGDALGCSSGGSLPREDFREIATERFGDNEAFTVRKGHFIIKRQMLKALVTAPHTMNVNAFDPNAHRVAFIIRDPRDIAVSGAHHWRVSVNEFLHHMHGGTGGVRFVKAWSSYVQAWLELGERTPRIIQFVKYEDLLASDNNFIDIMTRLHVGYSKVRAREAYRRQNFANRRKHVREFGYGYPLGREFNLRFMRRGVVGDWRNHFHRREAFSAEAYFGQLLRYFGYETTSNWWEEFT